MDGISGFIADAITTVGANVVTENGVLLKSCEHGIRHPVGHLYPPPGGFDATHETTIQQHEHLGPSGGALPIRCDGCCAAADATRAYYEAQDAEKAAKLAQQPHGR